jgi:hypothetical protein
MNYLTLIILFLLSPLTSALVLPRQASDQCCFTLYGQSPTLNSTTDEDTIGENRLNSTFPHGSYCVSVSAPQKLSDSRGHTCLIYLSNKQFQCTSGIPSTTNFTLADNNLLLHDGSQNWYACPAPGPGSDGSYNLFSDDLDSHDGCIAVTLLAGGFTCAALGRPSSTELSAKPTSTTTVQIASQTSNDGLTVVPFITSSAASTATASATSICPKGLETSTGYLVPHLLIPISPSAPSTAFGTTYSPIISENNSTIYSYDIPQSYAGTCALLFFFPFANKAVFPYEFTGIEQEIVQDSGIQFSILSGPVTEATTFDNSPSVSSDFGKLQILPGSNYTVGNFDCGSFAGKKLSVKAGSINKLGLQYFQNDSPSAIGLYVVPCS